MSVKIPELSFIDTFETRTTTVVNCEGYASLSYYVILEHDGDMTIQTSVDGVNFYTHTLVDIPTTGAIYQDKINITFKYVRYYIQQSLPGSCQLQSFFFEDGDVKITEYINSTGILTVNASGPINSSVPGGPVTNISISQATTSVDGFLAYTDFQTFNNKISSVSGSAPISVTSGVNPIISLDDTAVVPGSYTLVSATVDQKGRLTSIGNGTAVTSLTAGTGISLSGGTGAVTITNTAPDQTVSLTSGTGISATGTYPNFTITNTAPDQTVALTGGTGISTSGAYPNFTITNTAPDQTVALTAGTGISTTGAYPNFTITNSGVTSLTSGTGISLSGGTGGVTVTNSAPDQTVALTSGTGISVTGAYPNFTITNTSTPASVKSMIITPYDTIHASTTTQYFCSFFHGGRQNAANQFYSIMPSAGTFKNMYVSTSAALGLSDTCTYTLYKSTGATALTCTLGSSDTSGSDLTHNVSCSAGDLFCWSFQNSNGNGASVRFSISCEFYPS